MTNRSHRRRTAHLLGVGIALALVASACGGNKPTGAQASPPLVTSPPTTPSASPTSSAGGAGVTVDQVNFQFSPSTLTVHKGDAIAVKDATTGTPHTFTISGKGIDVRNDAGQTQSVVIDLAPGTYKFFCVYHQAQGMTGTLTVT
jgi:plastocyanin